MKTTTLRLIAATFFILHFSFFISIGRAAANAPAVTIATLLEEMTNRDAIARFPEPAFTCKQFSSYNRASVAKDKPGWFTNGDNSMFLRVETHNDRRELVMLDTTGPGAIVRFWMTFAGKNCGRGTMRVYIDGNPIPAIEGAALDILSGGIVTAPPLAASVSELSPYDRRGHNLYFPIPYAKSCKITYQADHVRVNGQGATTPNTERVFYNINYRTYDPSVRVVPYSKAELLKHKNTIETALKLLSAKPDQKTPPPAGTTHRLDTTLQPGESATIAIGAPGNTTGAAAPTENCKLKTVNSCGGLAAPGAIQHIAMRLRAQNQEQALRSTILEIAFDGKKTVRAPIGDFFGVGHKQLHTNTWYAAADEKSGHMQAWWIMPFEKNCTITLRNLGAQPVRITDASVNIKPWHWDNRSMHFGAGWRQYTHIFAGPDEQALDLTFAHLEGKGVYVGDGIALFDPAARWWGEGDEKIYVDGESFPSHFGTGTEDYYGYAWCRPETFTDHPFIAQPLGAGNLAPGHSVNTRVRALDRIPFRTSIQVDMELWPATPRKLNYAPIAFWYMTPGGRSLAADDDAGAKQPVAQSRVEFYPPILDKDLSIEGENLSLVSHTGGQVEQQKQRVGPQKNQRSPAWSHGAQLWWRDAAVGDRALFAFDSEVEAQVALHGVFTVARDYGVFDVYLNGKKIFAALDLGGRDLGIKTFTSSPAQILKGRNHLAIELVANAKDRRKSHFGLDKLTFK